MSEIEYLIKQLEYSFNTGNNDKAHLIVKELIKLNAKIKISYELKYECSSHFQKFNQKLFNKELDQTHYFPKCNHYVCKECIRLYITENFEKNGADFKYTCPGCNALGKRNRTMLDYKEKYFSDIIPQEKFEESLFQKQTSLNQVMSSKMIKECYFTRANPHKISCTRTFITETLQRCSHNICVNCAKQYINKIWEMTEDKNLKCFVEGCESCIDHEFIEKIYSTESLDDPSCTKIFLKLDVSQNRYFTCKGCQTLNRFPKSLTFQKCRHCDLVLCCLCLNQVHNNKPCYAVVNNIYEYTKFECDPNQEIEEFKLKYFHAVSLFEWELNPKGAAALIQARDYKLQVTKVTYIYNPLLIERFEAAKDDIRRKNGDTKEIFVFHASRTENIESICRNGFLIGGIDVDVAIGSLHGYGVYAASDASLSISYFLKSKMRHEWIFVCKAIRGFETRNPIKDKEELANTKFNSVMINFDCRQSNIYVFLQKEIIIPYYLVHFE